MSANLTIVMLAMIAGAWVFLQLIAKARQEAVDRMCSSELQAKSAGNDPAGVERVPEVFGDR
jgi:hypothetical protein